MNIEDNELWKLQQSGFRIVKFIPCTDEQCARIEEWNDGEWIYFSEYNYWELSDYDREIDKFRHNQNVIVINS